MAVLVAAFPAAHDGLGSALADAVGPDTLLPVAVALLPAVVFAPALGEAAVVAALAAPVATAWLVGRWAEGHLGGVSGDVLGAANELGRAAGLHAGVIAWTLF
jgi:adenosylcobinamide-GDP ribazoletransferase